MPTPSGQHPEADRDPIDAPRGDADHRHHREHSKRQQYSIVGKRIADNIQSRTSWYDGSAKAFRDR
ncbi:hypothetical protein [Mycobacterium bourgelatii]|uniref:hypothetical protein n=1 Tax=Mycobacterium bourgelatii TaxID=1273442 RepID=UPI0013D64FDC|nr:hypothetical protein [Mycobacterium bourgelatii]MCV6977880.1 hypothetical protein [Mycobacterium bourgelatii]